jgi:hypothetical protein
MPCIAPSPQQLCNEWRIRTRLRGQVLNWLRDNLTLWSKQLDGGTDTNRIEVQDTMRHWQEDADLARVHDDPALAALPASERHTWGKLWQVVAALVAMAGGK